MPSDRSIVVINYSAPEINHLAAALADKGLLRRYFRPYANQGRGWERLLERLPGLGGPYRKALGRRVMPLGFAPGQIRETATLTDFAVAALRKMPGKASKDLAAALHWQIQRRVAAIGARAAEDVEAVVASYVVAEDAFAATQGVRILNYPIAHHRYIQKFVAEEAERQPAFASTLPNWSGVPNWVESRVDRECALAQHILVGSTFARDSFLEEGVPAEKLVVIPYGADVTQFAPAGSDQGMEVRHHGTAPFNVLFVGQIGQRKGISYLLSAYESFKGPGTHLTLVGSMTGDASTFVPYRGLFTHIANVPRSRLAVLYREADVFVFPTLIEGLPLVVLEAMASGLPVITTPNGPGDVVRDGIDGFVVPIRDPAAITERLEYLRANPLERIAMGRNGRKRALTFTWEEYRRKSVEFVTQQCR